MVDQSPLEIFHPLIQRWFNTHLGQPTPIQQRAWPLIAGGNHVLITAPTGQGKTLAAFLWVLDQLIGGRLETGTTRILYVSPLKALNNDVERNLIRPLGQIRALFESAGDPFPEIRVATRSGDTPPGDRRKMIRKPPEILITTPESLHLMLSSHGGRSLLGRIGTVILDEVHAVVGNKRGTLLMSAVDRLVPLSGDFQRIALSATINPEDRVAAFIGGFAIQGNKMAPAYVPRTVHRCRDNQKRSDIIRITIPAQIAAGDNTQSIWNKLADSFKAAIDAHRSTLIFTNSRRLCEKLTFLINQNSEQPIAYAHHGSLSKALRLEVENRLKAGTLKAIVATASLELGIDIGSLDQVILVQSPPSISSAVQRIGRSGHGVGQSSQAEFVATHALDALTAATLARAIIKREIEPVHVVTCPLDVLAQVLVSMTGVETWDVDQLYNTLRASAPFYDLKRNAFDLVVEMLAGRYAATRIAALQPKIAFDRLENTLSARKGALLSLYTSGGVIPDRGYFVLRHQETGDRIGELDEEFVWEAKKGQVFTLGTQNWRIGRITHNDVFVKPARPKAPAPPFWRAEDADQDFFLADKIARLLEYAEHHLSDPGLVDEFCKHHNMNENGARYLIDFLARQQKRTGCALPHRHHLVVEQLPALKGGSGIGQIVIHTFWGGRVNRPFALALQTAWQRHFDHLPSIFATNAAVYVMPAQTIEIDDILSLVSTDKIESLIREALEGSGVFGARFRECAARALLLSRQRVGQRMPLWMSRLQSQRLLDAVGHFADFPIVLEAWRSCLQDDFDMDALKQVLDELEQGQISWTTVKRTSPSPMALSGSWRLVNQYMYANDRQQGTVKTRISRDLLESVVFTPELRPVVEAKIIDEFVEKRQRSYPGYAPDTPVELLEWVKERLMIPWPEWQALLDQIRSQGRASPTKMLSTVGNKLVRLIPAPGVRPDAHLIVAAEMAPVLACVLYTGETKIEWLDWAGQSMDFPRTQPARSTSPLPRSIDLLEQWLRFYGPVTDGFITERLALGKDHLADLLAAMVSEGTLICGQLIQGVNARQFCCADNYDHLLRMARQRHRAVIEPRDIDDLAWVLACFQGIAKPDKKSDPLMAYLQCLMGILLPAALWETDILPARIDAYDPGQLDYLMQASPLMWIGGPGKQITFCMEDDLDLITDTGPTENNLEKKAPQDSDDVGALFGDAFGRYPLSALLGDPPQPVQTVLDRLWAAVWTGQVTNDTMIALRQKAGKRNNPAGQPLTVNAMGRGAVRRFRRSRRELHAALTTGTMGNWRLINPPASPDGLVESEELVKDRVRLLLDRYGILFRQLLDREAPLFQWPAVSRALRLMELAGEISAGYFFKGISGMQFVSKAMLALLHDGIPDESVFWINAMDPASLCGLKIEAIKGSLPRRVASTHLVYLGRQLAMVSQRNGKTIAINLPVEHPRLSDCFGLFDHLLGRPIHPRRFISIETINGEPAGHSPFINLLRKRFDITIEAFTLTLYQRLNR